MNEYAWNFKSYTINKSATQSTMFTCTSEKERSVLYNNTLNTFYLRLYGVRHMVKDHQIAREETRCHHMGNSFRLAARVILYAPSHRQDNTYHSLCYTSRGALAGMRKATGTMKAFANNINAGKFCILV